VDQDFRDQPTIHPSPDGYLYTPAPLDFFNVANEYVSAVANTKIRDV